MQILVIAATDMEIKPLAIYLAKKNFTLGTNNIKLLITGIGGVATSYALTNCCNKTSADIIIQAGVAGCFTENNLSEVFAIKEEVFADLGVWENKKFNSIFDLKLSGKNIAPYKNGLLTNPYKKLLALSSLKKIRGITVNEITTDKKRIAWHKQNLAPVVESMEGAAFHYVCLQQKTPFIQLRAISNYVGERNKTKWKMKEAINNLNEKLIFLLTELSNYNETYFRI
jgi:futalosine hydrolase